MGVGGVAVHLIREAKARPTPSAKGRLNWLHRNDLIWGKTFDGPKESLDGGSRRCRTASDWPACGEVCRVSGTYRRTGYNETQLRQDFLDPFFVALGWDVFNQQGFAEAYRDVILEQGLKVEQSVLAPDYCFRIGGTAKFFVKPFNDVIQSRL